jgi:putative oxidoreductase
MTNAVLLASRLAVACCILPQAIARASNISGFSLLLSVKGVPYSSAISTIVLIAQLFGPVAMIFGFAPRVAAWALVAATVFTTGALHRFWELEGLARAAEQAAFFGNVGLAAGLLFYTVSGPGAWSWQAFWALPIEPTKDVGKRSKQKSASRSRVGVPAQAN